MPHQINESATRKKIIDPQLEHAGWYLRDHSRVKIEIPVDGYDAEPWNGVTDYCLYRENGEALAVVEAKKTSVDVRLAEAPSFGKPILLYDVASIGAQAYMSIARELIERPAREGDGAVPTLVST